VSREPLGDGSSPDYYDNGDNGDRYPPPFGQAWRAPSYSPQQIQPQRQPYGQPYYGQTYGQPTYAQPSNGQPYSQYGQQYGQPPRGSDPRSGPQPRNNSGPFWNWR
jgi:hypothetical protein